jgi:hypothetical protein
VFSNHALPSEAQEKIAPLSSEITPRFFGPAIIVCTVFLGILVVLLTY